MDHHVAEHVLLGRFQIRKVFLLLNCLRQVPHALLDRRELTDCHGKTTARGTLPCFGSRAEVILVAVLPGSCAEAILVAGSCFLIRLVDLGCDTT